MCTVTIVPTPGGWRMACNRDERHGRPAALAPQQRMTDGLEYLAPIDPVSDGTWVAVNRAGIGLTLLNYNLPDSPAQRPLSRGRVIPMLAGAATLEEAVARCAAVPREEMLPFRLVMCDGQRVMLWRSTEAAVGIEIASLGNWPHFFTSSGLGDHLVEQPRRALFDGWFTGDASGYADRQDALHRHRWDDRPHLSICMSRDDARTVSYTVIEVNGTGATMTYHPDSPDAATHDTTLSLDRLVPH